MDEFARERPPVARLLVGIAILIGFVWLCGVAIGACQSADRTGPTEVAVVHDGGPFDSKGQREVVGPSSSWMIPGLYSSWHKYIEESEQRFFRIGTEGSADLPGTAIEVPTRDGVQVSIEGTTNFHTAFTGEDDDPLLREFDQRFGNREFGGKHVWDGDEGWSAWLTAQFQPVLISTFREEIGSLDCADLVSSCALIQQGGAEAGQPTFTKEQLRDSAGSFQAVADAVQEKLAERLNTALGGAFLRDFQVQIERVVLPETVQNKINEAQAAFANISEQRARAEAAKFEAERIRTRAAALSEPGAAALEIANLYSEACRSSGGTCIVDASGNVGLNVAP